MSLKDKRQAAGSSWRPEPINPGTGYRKLPSFAVQPLLRILNTSNTGSNDNVDGAGERTERPPSPTGKINLPARCIHSKPTPCNGVAATRCPTKACITHCREIRALAEGMDPNTMNYESLRGGLVGRGCEAHESKAAAKMALYKEKKKARVDGRLAGKVRKAEAKRKAKEEIVGPDHGAKIARTEGSAHAASIAV